MEYFRGFKPSRQKLISLVVLIFMSFQYSYAQGSDEIQLQEIVDASLNYYRTLRPTISISEYKLVKLSADDWLGVSNNTKWKFEAGYVEGTTVYVTEPVSADQSKIFPDIESVIRYTIAKEMVPKICNGSIPDWFLFGYPAYEAHLSRQYESVQGIYSSNGTFPDMSYLASFDPENNEEQRNLAFTLAEYCILVQGDRVFPNFNSTGELQPYNDTSIDDAWHLFLEKHYLVSENQIKILTANAKFAIYGSAKNEIDASDYLNDLSSLLNFYEEEFQVNITRRVDILINPDRCTQLLVEGWECDSNEGGGGHGNGMAGCSLIPYSTYSRSIKLLLHEFTHVYQFWLKSNFMPAWLSEGFAQRLSGIQTIPDPFVDWKDDMAAKWTLTIDKLGRYPTMAELMNYSFVRSNDIDYYTLGALMVDYIIQKGGYQALFNVVKSDGLDFTSMGYDSKEDFLADFYLYFDIRIMDKSLVTLNSPVQSSEMSADATVINMDWTPISEGLKLDIYYSVDEGTNWDPLVQNFNDTKYDWNFSAGLLNVFYLKFSSPENLNISSVYGPFYVKPSDPDWNILASNEKFSVWGYLTEQEDANAVLTELSQNYDRIHNILQVDPDIPLQVYIYPDLTAFHEAIDWPDAPDWVVGTGGSSISIVAPSNPGPTSSFDGILNISIHEMAHCFVRELAAGSSVPIWLNEGTATYLAKPGISPDKTYIKNLISDNGGIPTLDALCSAEFADIGGYAFSQTIVEFIVNEAGGENALRQFIASDMDYSLLGFSSQDDFQTAWEDYLDRIYLAESDEEYNMSAEATICQGEIYQFGTQLLSVSGVYTEVFKSINDCDSTVVLTLMVNAVEQPVITQQSDTLICNMDGVCNWYLNNQLIEDANSPKYIIKESGNYEVIVRDANGCNSPVSESIYVTTTDVGDLLFAKSVIVYPNPTIGEIKIEGLNLGAETILQLFDLEGRKVYSKQVTSTSMVIDITRFSSGLYSLIVRQGNNNVSYKIIKE